MRVVVNDFLKQFKLQGDVGGGEESKVEVRRGIIDRYYKCRQLTVVLRCDIVEGFNVKECYIL